MHMHLLDTAEPSIRDSSQKTALDYATEKGLHYCSLLLTNSEDLLEGVDRYSGKPEQSCTLYCVQ